MNLSHSNGNIESSQRVLAALQEARQKIEQIEREKQERVAIIGMSGRFPGADTVEQFWQNLCSGINSIQLLSPEALQAAGADPDLIQHPNYVNAHASLDDIAGFDAAFFGYSPREAELIDPQHRVFLECAWSALEQAGYDPSRYPGAIGLYAGAALNSYLINLYSAPQLRQSVDRVQAVISNVLGLMPTRVSYKLNLKGPSCGIQTGCSTSLVAVHLACQSLLNRESDLALAGGVAIDASGQLGYLYQEDSVMSPDGYCRAFDANAKGTVFGNGVGIVVLKRLSEAIADRDYIYAVIRGSAINNDGAQKVGLTAPSVSGQAAVIAAALAKAAVSAASLQYIETHGTGTALGDPIEIAALTKVFQQPGAQPAQCAIGSVKTNIGHLDAAAGISGLIKTALALKHRQIPPSLNFTDPNPQIDFANSPFYVNTQLLNWPISNAPRRAAVSSFGMGGTNAHLVLESAPEHSPEDSRSDQLILLSAKTVSALKTASRHLLEHLQTHPEQSLSDIAYTLQIGRQPFEYRHMLVCSSREAAIQMLSSEIQPDSNPVAPLPASVAFLFPGQGSQYPNMGRQLYETEPIFRTAIDRCCQILPELDLLALLYPSPSSPPSLSLYQTALAQPALFTLEYALAQLWQSWGIQPVAMIGHSIGEYVAAHLAGVFSLEDALKLVALRGRLMQSCPEGAMLSVNVATLNVGTMAAAQIKDLLQEGSDVTLAAINSSQQVVLSGSHDAIAALEQQLRKLAVPCRQLQTSHAFHSAAMEPILGAFVAQVAQVSLRAPKIPLISNVTGTWMTAEQAIDPAYWGQQLRQTVQFAAGLQTVQAADCILLEVGAGRTLTTFAKQSATETLAFPSLRHPQEQTSDLASMLNALGHLWLAGVEIDWTGFYAAEQRQRVPLPTYPFEHQRYWIDLYSQNSQNHTYSDSPDQLHKYPDIANWFYLPSWKRMPSPAAIALERHQNWLIFLDPMGLGEALAQHLRQLGQTVITVSPSERYTQAEQHYELAPACADHYTSLLSDLGEQDAVPDQIVHCWGSLEVQPKSHPGFSSLVMLGRVLRSTAQVTVVTQGLQDIIGAESPQPLQATLLGACRVISQEYLNLQCSTVDFYISESEVLGFSQPVQQLLQEILSPVPETVAYRYQHRWVQTYEPILIPADPAAEPNLRQDGTYLIAGDLVEGLGLVFARYLAEAYQAQLILIGRAGLPEPADWEKWLATHGQQDPVSRCLRVLQGIAATGCDLRFFSADLTDQARLQAIVAQIDAPIHGVIHADRMGDRASCLIASLDQREIERQFQAKIAGLLTLDQVLHGKVSDFCLLQSSLSAIVGGVGFAAYAGANCFLDAFARSRHEAVPWISVNWDACRFEQPADAPATGQALIDLAIAPSEVWEVTKRVLSRPELTQVIVSPADLPSRIRQAARNSIVDTASHIHSRPQLSTEYVPPRSPIEQTVAAAMQELLGIESIGIYDNFFELGGHSLLAIQAVTRLRQTFQIELPMRDFLFEAPTVAGIAQIIAENLAAAASDPQEIADLLTQIEQMDSQQLDQLDQLHIAGEQ